MTVYRFQTWDVFTTRRFAGNQLAVIMDAEGLSADDMQAIAGEFNLAETSFVFPPEDGANTAGVRIFTPGYEMPFAGHPTIGTAIALAEARGLEGAMTLELPAGLFPIEIDRSDEVSRAAFINPNTPAEAPIALDRAGLAAALGLPAAAIDDGAHKPRRINAGVNYIFARAALADVVRARPNLGAIEAITGVETVGVLLYAEGGEADADYHVRMFAPGAGVPEDAATGSAAAALPGQLLLAGVLSAGTTDLVIEQGVEMGRPSRIEVRVSVEDGGIARVRVAGAAIRMQTGEIAV